MKAQGNGKKRRIPASFSALNDRRVKLRHDEPAAESATALPATPALAPDPHSDPASRGGIDALESRTAAARSDEGSLHGVALFLHASVTHLNSRLKVLQRRVENLGGKVAATGVHAQLNSARRQISHVVVGKSVQPALLEDLVRVAAAAGSWIVSEDWLNKVLSKGATVPEAPFSLNSNSGQDHPDAPASHQRPGLGTSTPAATASPQAAPASAPPLQRGAPAAPFPLPEPFIHSAPSQILTGASVSAAQYPAAGEDNYISDTRSQLDQDKHQHYASVTSSSESGKGYLGHMHCGQSHVPHDVPHVPRDVADVGGRTSACEPSGGAEVEGRQAAGCAGVREDIPRLRAAMALALLPDPTKAVHGCRPAHTAPLARYYPWLGYWHPCLDAVTRVPELMMWARYSKQRCIAIGNETVAAALRQLHKYEEAIGGTKGNPGESRVNHRALSYAHAAATVRACSFRLTAEHTADMLQDRLPFVAEYTASVIFDLITSGSCEQLEAFKHDAPARDSRGRVRLDSQGGHTRWMFTRIPGVGAGLAAKLYEAGYGSYEELEAAARDDGPLGKGGGLSVPQEARFCIQHHQDILAEVAPSDVDEMQKVVLTQLETVSGTAGFQMMLVGGGRRSHTVHDADSLVTHPTHSMQGLVWDLYKALVAEGKLVSQEDGFCRIQSNKQGDYMGSVRRDILLGHWNDRHQMDRYDHIWGIFRTRAGCYRRMDVMLVPYDQWPLAVIGWTGSKQYLRFMRTHASQCGMFLNSHCLMRKTSHSALQVPSEAAPLDSKGQEFWPDGDDWGSAGHRKEITREEHLFQMLRVPCWQPADRDCP